MIMILPFLFLSLTFQSLQCEEIPEPSDLPACCHACIDENGVVVQTFSVEQSPDNLLLLKRSQLEKGNEMIYSFENHQLVRIQEFESNGAERDLPYEAIDAINEIIALIECEEKM